MIWFSCQQAQHIGTKNIYSKLAYSAFSLFMKWANANATASKHQISEETLQ